MLTLLELIRDTPFGLQLVTRGTSTNRRIDGGHVVEMPDPCPWLAKNYLALTAGVALKGSVARQEEFVASVHRAGSTALGFGVGVHCQSIPQSMIAAGEQLGLPIVSVPLEVPFREVLTFISRSTLAGFQDFRRTLRFQDYLLASLEESDAEASLARRLGELIAGGIAIFRCDGRVAASAGRPPLAEMWTAIRNEENVVQLGLKRLVWNEVRLDGEPCYYLAACVRDDDRSTARSAEVLKLGARAAQAVAAACHLATVQERAIKRHLLADVLASSVIAPETAARLGVFGLDPQARTDLLAARPFSGRDDAGIVVAQDATTGSEELARVVEACEAALTRSRVPHLACVAAGRVAVAIWQDDSDETAVVKALRETATEDSLSIGLSRRNVENMWHIPQALIEAAIALQRSEGMAEPAVVTHEELSLSDLVLTYSPPELTAVAQSVLAPLRCGRPEMFQTLSQYLEHDCDVIACAKDLYIHPNTLRYRLSRIEVLLGRSLRSVSTIAELHLALRLDQRT